MAVNVLESTYFYRQTSSLRDTALVNQLQQTHVFIAENGPLVETAMASILSVIDRFGIPREYREKTATEIVFLWTQAKLAQKAASRFQDNRISGFNVGAAIGIHLQNSETNQTEFFFSTGANREPDMIAIATHAETSAIESARQQLLYILEKGEKPPGIDLVALTGAAPCGSCREEIYTYRTSDNALIAVISDEGDVSVNTIKELFPTEFPEYDIDKVPKHLMEAASRAADRTIPSRYQLKDALPAWGVAVGLATGQYETGYSVGDDAFWSGSPTLDAIGKILRCLYDQKLLPAGQQRDFWQLATDTEFPKVNQVVYCYRGPTLPFYLSGKERQQLTILPENTEIYIVLSDTNQAFKTTRAKLLPNAFTAPQS